ncbi:hypothetical protein BOSE21B_30421 [Bosea sp. 21B]|nr:hypothetical protein BOSE21B_30421 [Bosea sp. 21B]VXC06929.1 hypothetical protein BOSE127_170132 [Bosea sp. 127]
MAHPRPRSPHTHARGRKRRRFARRSNHRQNGERLCEASGKTKPRLIDGAARAFFKLPPDR